MFLMLKLILIISINFRKLHADSMQDSKVILLPAWNSTEAEKLSLTLKVFGKVMQLNLRRNDQVLSSVFKMWKNERNVTEMLSKLKTSDFCLYLHDDYVSTAAIDICQEDGLKGFVIMDKDLIEIQPLQAMFFNHDFCAGEQINQSFGKLHLIRRSVKYFAGLDFYHLHKIRPKRSSNKTVYIIQLAVTFDHRVYNGIMNFLEFNKKKMHELAWSYVNEIQTIFDWIDEYRVKLLVTQFHFMKNTPFWHFDNNAHFQNYLFCEHMGKFKPWDIDNPYYWDIHLYIYGINDIFSGDSFQSGACNESTRTCATVAFPLAQFQYYIYYKDIEFFGLRHEIQQSARIAAREIANSIGVNYDYYKCKDSIMCKDDLSYVRDIKWSRTDIAQMQLHANEKYCLQDHPKSKNLDCSKWSTDTSNSVESYELPGRTYNAKQQCMFLLADENANVVTLHDVCKNLQCEVHFDNRSHFFGRALNGTYCAPGKECCDGECVSVVEPPYIFNYCEDDNWSKWEEDSCKSDCLEGSKGVKIRRRTCKHQGLKTGYCSGPYYDVILCDHSKLCNSYKTISAYASQKCSEFIKVLNLTDVLPQGFQHYHIEDEPWMACTIYCQLIEFHRYTQLREELIDDVDPYFPDGTLCYREDNQNYYCRQHYCLPENHSFIEKCEYSC